MGMQEKPKTEEAYDLQIPRWLNYNRKLREDGRSYTFPQRGRLCQSHSFHRRSTQNVTYFQAYDQQSAVLMISTFRHNYFSAL